MTNMTQYGTWTAYSGWSAILLGVILLAITTVLLYWGIILKRPLKVKPPGLVFFISMLLIWVLSIVTFINNVSAYFVQLVQKSMVGIPPFNPVSYVTYPAVFITFIIIFIVNRKSGLLVALFSAFICAVAATMLFELPFDIIVISRTYPPIPPSPLLYRGVFFLPLFLIEITTISLVLFSPLMQITKYTCFSLAGMFFIYAIWGFWGFAYPSSILLLIYNIVSKLFAFIAASTLFLPQKYVKRKNS